MEQDSLQNMVRLSLYCSEGYLPNQHHTAYIVWHAPPELNAFAASLALGLSANLYARITDDFAFNGIVAGVFIQVPGSWGMRGLLSFAYGVSPLPARDSQLSLTASVSR